MEAKPEPSSLDSDSGEESDEDERWLDPSEKQDVLALRRLGFGISELGERKLKGLETAEVISLIWPKALKERIKAEGAKVDAVQAEVYECVSTDRHAKSGQRADWYSSLRPSSQVLDVALVKALGRVTHRLEAASAAIVHRSSWEEQRYEFEQSQQDGQLAVVRNPALRIHPTTLAYPIRPDSSDDELAALLEVSVEKTGRKRAST